MSVSVVNGFVCYSSCDVSKAKQGKDPHPSTSAGNANQDSEASRPGRADEPAVVFGGSLLRTSAIDSVNAVADTQAANDASLSRSKFALDVLA
jgi:hypothetical protein